jgi:DNA-binding transcriptional MerR regulator
MTDHQCGATAVAFSQSTLSSRRYFTIGQLAREFGLTLRALRFYEDRGLISPKREGNTRIYTLRDRARVAVVVRAKALGFTLSEIKDTLAAEDPFGEPAGLTLTEAQVADQIAHLEQQKADVDAALAELNALRAKMLSARAA